jgi:hypothetical protein
VHYYSAGPDPTTWLVIKGHKPDSSPLEGFTIGQYVNPAGTGDPANDFKPANEETLKVKSFHTGEYHWFRVLNLSYTDSSNNPQTFRFGQELANDPGTPPDYYGRVQRVEDQDSDTNVHAPQFSGGVSGSFQHKVRLYSDEFQHAVPNPNDNHQQGYRYVISYRSMPK